MHFDLTFVFGCEGARDGEKELEEEEYEDDEESLSGENLKSHLSLLTLPRLQKLFKNLKNFSQSFGKRVSNTSHNII